MVEHKDIWRPDVSTAMNLLVPENAENLRCRSVGLRT